MITPTRGQVLVTEPLGELLFDRPHYARHGYDYWHQTPDRRLVVGGCRDATLELEYTDEDATTEPIQRELDGFAAQLAGGPVQVTHRWAGIWGTTPTCCRSWGPCLDTMASGSRRLLRPRQRARARRRRPRRAGDPRRPAPELDLLDPARLVGASGDPRC